MYGLTEEEIGIETGEATCKDVTTNSVASFSDRYLKLLLAVFIEHVHGVESKRLEPISVCNDTCSLRDRHDRYSPFLYVLHN